MPTHNLETIPTIDQNSSEFTFVQFIRRDLSYDDLLQFSVSLSPFDIALVLLRTEDHLHIVSCNNNASIAEQLKQIDVIFPEEGGYEQRLLKQLEDHLEHELDLGQVRFNDFSVNTAINGTLCLISQKEWDVEFDEIAFMEGLSNQLISKLKTSLNEQLVQFQGHSLDRCEEGFAWIDQNGKIVHFNRHYLELTGFDVKDLKEKKISSFDPHYSEQNWKDHWEEVQKRGKVQHETIFQSARAGQRPVDMVSEFVTVEGHKYVHVICRDITEKKLDEYRSTRFQGGLMLLNQLANKPEHSLADLISELIHLLTSFYGLPFGMVTKIEKDKVIVLEHQSPDEEYRYPTGQSLNLNEIYCSSTLKTFDVLSISSASQSDYREHLAYKKHKLETYIGCAILVGHEVYGTLHFSSFKSRRIDFDSYDREFLKLAANWLGAEIERSMNKERLITARTIAEEAAQAKALFLSTMSHEIRTPLNGIIGIGRLMAAKDLQEDQRKYVNLLNTTSDNLLAIVNDVLDFDKIDRGKVELEKIDFSLKRLISNITDMGKIQLDSKPVDLEVDFGLEVAEMYHGDSVRIGQVLNNLISNAIKFTSEGRIRVSVEAKELKEYHILKISVEDSGIGIDQKDQEKIFEDFTQAEASTTRKYGGTGLGLSICKGLLELMNTKLQVDSTIGKGANFWFELKLKPIKLRDEVGWAREKSIHEVLTDRVILLVDDDAPNRLILEQFLIGFGATVVLAKDGREVIEKACSRAVDVIFMDLQMPHFSGFEATDIIRSFEGTYFKNIPIIALTADCSELTQKQIENSALDGFMTKPLRVEAITKDLKKHFSRKNRVNPINTIASLNYVHKSTNGRTKSAIKYLEIVIESVNANCDILVGAMKNQDTNQVMELLHKLRPSLKSVDLQILFGQSTNYEADLKTGAFLEDLEIEIARYVVDVRKSMAVIQHIRTFMVQNCD